MSIFNSEWKIISYKHFNPIKSAEFIKKNKYCKYYKNFICLDTETSHNHNLDNPKGWIYQWCFSFQHEIVYGRKPTELIDCLKKLSIFCKDNEQIIIYVHNLSYDIQYLKNYLISTFGEYKIIATDTHQFISFEIGCFCFKCSYKLSNRSLSKWAKDLNVKHKKLINTVDYNKIHYQDSLLYKNDWKYMFYDVISLDECINKQLSIYNDTIITIPLTSTGYVRRTCRENFKKDNNNWKQFQDTKMSESVYIVARKAFSGGLTHGNRFFQEQTVVGNIKHRDFVSHYPSQQRVRKYPIGKFVLQCKQCSLDKLKELSERYCCLAVITFHNVELKSKSITFPYLQYSKVREGRMGNINVIQDNGRVLKCSGFFTLYLTEIDAKIIFKQYKFGSVVVNKVYTAQKGYLPKFMIDTIDTFFYEKTYYKEESKKNPNNEDMYISLMKSKNGLNGIYGMSATDPIRDIYIMETNGKWRLEKTNIIEGLEKFYKSRNSFMRYVFGVYCTAYAREELISFIELIGYENCLYCDTDSIYYISNEEIENRIETYNKKLLQESEKIGAYIETEKGKQYYNQFELEKEEIAKFRFLHSKCYAYELSSGELKATIAGVNQKSRVKELQKIDNLKGGFVFKKSGGMRIVYDERKQQIELINGHLTEYSSSGIILETEKTLHNKLDKQLSLFL